MAVGNSGDVIISQTSFYGGMGTDKKIGIKNSYADSESVDARKNPSVMTVLPGSRKLVDGDIDGLIVSMTQTPDGNRWGIATNGDLYKIDANNDVIKAATMPGWTIGTHGDLLYWSKTDSIYVTGLDTIYQYSPVLGAGTPAIKTLTGSHSTYPTMAQILVRDRDDKWIGGGTSRWTFKNGSSGTYAVPTTIQEADTHKSVFLTDKTPLVAMELRFRAKPASGTVTISIHDSGDKLLTSSTVSATDISTTGRTKFTFNQTVLEDIYSSYKEYHIHVTASATGFTIDTYEASQLYGLHFWYYSALLIRSRKKFHPMWNWGGSKIIIGNGKYIAVWDPVNVDVIGTFSEYEGNKILIEDGMEITSITSNDEYVVFGCERVGNDGTRVFQSGMLGFWDGFADYFNFKIDTPMGEPKSLYTYQNITYMIIDGAIYAYTGSKALTKIRTIIDSQSEYTGVEDKTDIFTHAMTVRRGILLMAYPSTTNLTTMRHGIYSYGSVDKDYPNSFYYSYQIPEVLGNYNTAAKQLTIGGVWNYGDTLYFSYLVHDNDTNTDTFNIAIVDNSSLPARNFKYESLTFDGGMPWKEKEALRAVASFDPLPEGCKIKLKYKIDNRPWTVDTREAIEGATEVYFEINKRFREIQFGIVGTNEGTTYVPARVTSVGINVRELGEEGKMHK